MSTAIKIRIIATEANRLGDLFGRLVSDLFLSLGYDGVRLNIARSGREIDVEAEHRLEARRALAECKALDEKVGGAEINKFAGKLRPERSRRPGHGIAGYFVSLSGFTETAIDQEREAQDEAILLIDGARLVGELIKGRIVVSPEMATAQAGKVVTEHQELVLDDSAEIFAHRMGWLWAIFFSQGKQRTHFVLIHADGTPLSAVVAKDVAQEVRHVYEEIATLTCLNPVVEIASDQRVRLAKTVTRYKDYLRAECGSIMLDGLPADGEVGALKLRLENLFVPLHVIVDPGGEANAPSKRRHRTTGKRQLFGDLLRAHNRLAILASPGGGKSTLLKRIAIAYCDPERRHLIDDHLPDRAWLPIFLRCRELRETARAPFPELIETLADRALLSEDKPAFRAYVLEALRTGDALLLVDGLDEITNVSDRASFVRGVQTFLAIYPSVNIVITSRKAGFRQVAGLLASICLQADMSDFDTNDIERLTVSWHREVIGDRPEVIADAKQLAQTICTNDRIKRLAANPLLLTALLLVKRWVGQLPTKRSVLYGKAVEVLLMTWNVEGHEPIEQDEALPQLCYVAYSMMQGGIQKISRAELSRLLMKAREDLAAELGFARIAVTEFIERIESRSSLMMLSGHDVVDGTLTEFYEFRHLTFQEYLTAKAIIEGWYPLRGNSDNIVTLLEPHFTDEKWREVLPLVAVLAGRRAEPLVQKLIETCGKNLAISQRLAKCLADEVQVTREIIQAAIKALLYRGGGWTAERQFIGTGKYGPLLRQEAGAVYLHNGSLRLNVLRAIGEVVLSMIVQSGKPVWNGLKELLESGDILRRCEGALALRLVSTFEGKYLGQMADALLPLLKSKEVAEQLAGCAALHQMGHKKFRTVQDAELSAGFTKRVIEPLLELWIGESEPLIQEAALRALCVLPLDINMRDVEVNGDLREAFLKRTNLWGDLSRDEKVASLVVAFLMRQPWSAEDLLTRSIELNRDLKGYRIKKLRELVTLLGGELPSVTRQSRRGKRRASLDAPDGAMEFENSGGSNVSEEPTTPISWVNAVSNPLS